MQEETWAIMTLINQLYPPPFIKINPGSWTLNYGIFFLCNTVGHVKSSHLEWTIKKGLRCSAGITWTELVQYLKGCWFESWSGTVMFWASTKTPKLCSPLLKKYWWYIEILLLLLFCKYYFALLYFSLLFSLCLELILALFQEWMWMLSVVQCFTVPMTDIVPGT